MRHLLAALALITLTTPALAEAPRVVATIKPIHALVAAVMGDLGPPALLVQGAGSPHTYSLKPSDAAALEAADLVFWTGHGMELFLEDSLATLAPRATTIALSTTPGLELLPIREGGAFDAHVHGDDDHDHAHEHDAHEHDHEHDGHEHGHEHHDAHEAMDMHFWLDPANAVLMLAHIAETLGAADPEHLATYAANAAAETARLEQLTAEIEAKLAPVRDRPFIVFHDAYQYFERRFGLDVVGSLTVSPDTMPGAQRISELRARIAERQAACVFAEPQFEPAIVATLIEGSAARAGTLDPEGAGLAEGPSLYGELLHGLADSLLDCLGADTAP